MNELSTIDYYLFRNNPKKTDLYCDIAGKILDQLKYSNIYLAKYISISYKN